MEPHFWTEKETEHWLESETRSVKMPDGSMRPVTDFRLLWENFDCLCAAHLFTEERLVELALDSSKETGHSFEDSFVSVVACAMGYVKKYLKD